MDQKKTPVHERLSRRLPEGIRDGVPLSEILNTRVSGGIMLDKDFVWVSKNG